MTAAPGLARLWVRCVAGLLSKWLSTTSCGSLTALLTCQASSLAWEWLKRGLLCPK
jgi:hypothetical protein